MGIHSQTGNLDLGGSVLTWGGGGDMKRRVYVGTYTGGNQSDSPLTGSKGIYAFSLQDDGKGLSFTGCYSNNDIDPGFWYTEMDTCLWKMNEKIGLFCIATE